MQGLIRQARFAEAAALVADPRDPTRAARRSPSPTAPTASWSTPPAHWSASARTTCGAGAGRPCAAWPRPRVTGAGRADLLAARAHLLARLGRHDEAAADAQQVAGLGRPPGRPGGWPRPLPTTGACWRCAAGRLRRGRRPAGPGARRGAPPSAGVAGRLTRAEALALAGDARRRRPPSCGPRSWSRSGRADQAVGPGAADRPRPGPRRRAPGGPSRTPGERLDECLRSLAPAWRHRRGRRGEEYLASLVDLGRPPVVGLVEPDARAAPGSPSCSPPRPIRPSRTGEVTHARRSA